MCLICTADMIPEGISPATLASYDVCIGLSSGFVCYWQCHIFGLWPRFQRQKRPAQAPARVLQERLDYCLPKRSRIRSRKPSIRDIRWAMPAFTIAT